MKKTFHSFHRSTLPAPLIFTILCLLPMFPSHAPAQEKSEPSPPQPTLEQRLRARRNAELDPRSSSRYIGLVRATQLTLSPATDGVIRKLNVRSGDRVKAGDLLAELDDRRAMLNLERSKIQLEIAKLELVRVRKLRDAATDDERQLAALHVKLAESEVARAQLDVADTRITAPFDGIVQLNCIPGQRISAKDSLGSLVEENNLKIRFRIPVPDAQALQTGQAVQARPANPTLPDQRFEARITSISPVVDPSTGTILIEAELGSPAKGLLPGMNVDIVLPPAKPPPAH